MEEIVGAASTIERIRTAIELLSLAIEVLAVAIILIAIAFGTTWYLIRLQQRAGDSYREYRVRLGKALLLGLELLVAADIVRTVALEATLQAVIVLGVLVVVRTVLSWSIVVEIEGRWPWRAALESRGREAE